MRKRMIRTSLLVVAILIAPLAFPGVALAQATSATMSGESLLGIGSFRTEPGTRCEPDGSGTIKYSVTGVAIGPYPGTFEETGTVTLGPTPPPQGGAFVRSPVTSFSANFTIFAGGTIIRGSKTLGDPESSFLFGFFDLVNEGECLNAAIFAVDQFGVAVEYTAAITTQGGTVRDSGVGYAFGAEARHVSPSNIFHEEFASTRGAAASVTLEPATATNPVGTRHTVTATVRNAAGEPVSGSEVLFETEGAVAASGSCTTNQEGRCSFSFEGPSFPGEVVITGCADANENNQRDPGEPCGSASKTYVLPVSTPGLTTGGGQILHLSETGVTFGLTFQSDQNGLKGECNLVDHPSGEQKLDCLDVLAYVQSGNEATIYGNATIEGQPAGLYRLHVVDNGESGIGRDLFELETQSGYVRAGLLTQGDVQVHT